jgi:large subunit ribosomal protein L3
MAQPKRPRKGSLQYWPRKRAAKVLPSVNWKPVKGDGLLGFITYKAGMASVLIKDNTEKSMTQGKNLIVPATILEVPNMKIFSVRFYKNNQVLKEIIVSNDKELKKLVKLPKTLPSLDSTPKDFDDIRVIAYSLPKQISLKKTPDMIELAISSHDKLSFVKSLINKEISLSDFKLPALVDIHGLTKGKGLVGPMRRFGISKRQHKSEKGVRRPGSLAPWHPHVVTFHAPMAGQLGMFSRVQFNLKVLGSGNAKEKPIAPKSGFRHYGAISSNYIIVLGSVQGPPKRQILITPSFRPTKLQSKKKFEFLEVLH